MSEPVWLTWARELQAVAQTGLTYARDPFDVQRYEQVHALALRIMAVGSGTDVHALTDLFSDERGYATPKVAVRGAAFRDGRLLLVRETSDGLWSLPGGWADVNDTASECLVREIKEESGFDARVVKLAALYDSRKYRMPPPHPFHVYNLFFVCEVTGGSAQTSLETTEVSFFDEGALPELSPSRVEPAQVARMFEHYRNPALPADMG